MVADRPHISAKLSPSLFFYSTLCFTKMLQKHIIVGYRQVWLKINQHGKPSLDSSITVTKRNEIKITQVKKIYEDKLSPKIKKQWFLDNSAKKFIN